jgi:hypothetical protein
VRRDASAINICVVTLGTVCRSFTAASHASIKSKLSISTVVDGLKAVSEALPTRNPWTILNFLAQPDDRLSGRKPIDVLKEGRISLVVEAAQRLGQQGS